MILKEILSIQSESYQCWRMFAYIIRQAKYRGWDYKVDRLGNIYITKGEADIYPCIVAHMDTVHEIVEDLTVVEVQGAYTGINAYTMEQTGIGGDDKVGIWVALNFLNSFEFGKAAFFVDEEVGCNGSYSADMSFFEDCSFVLQCDRKGNSDFVVEASGVELSDVSFQQSIKGILDKYGYKLSKGLMTDVMALKENGLKCCAANISCGYYNPHSHTEYVDIQDANNCMNLCFDIIENMSGVIWPHTYVRKYTPPVITKDTYTYKSSKKKASWEDSKTFFDPLDDWRDPMWEMEEDLDPYDMCESCCKFRQVSYHKRWGANLCRECTLEIG